MRRLALGGALAALAMGSFMPPAAARHIDDFGPVVLPSRTPRPKANDPRIDGKKARRATIDGRRIGRRDDPFFGLKSVGRLGARARSRAMEAARLVKTRHSRSTTGRVFKSDKREAEFGACLKLGWSRNIALKKARRVAA